MGDDLNTLMHDPIAFKAMADPDTMYMDQALQAPDREQFLKAMEKEVQEHTTCEH